MATRIYILTLEGEPLHAYTNLQRIKDECQKWFDDHSDDYDIRRDFSEWAENLDYPHTEAGDDAAWCDYVNSEFEMGTWGDYAWYEA